MATRTIVQKQLRGFVMAWTAITAVIAVATFFAIYLTYGGDPLSGNNSNIALPIAGGSATPSISVAVNVTAPPTLNVPATVLPAPTETPVVVAQVETETTADDPDNAALDDGGGNTAAQTDDETAATDETTGDDQVGGRDVVPVIEMTPTTAPVEDNRFQVGIQVQSDPGRNATYQDGWMQEVSEKLGMNWYKLQVRWEDIEPEKGEYDWGALRYAIRSARKYNVKIMISVVTAPEWAREPGVDLTKHGPPANAQDYVNFVTEVFNRFQGDIHAIEVWNEQNLDREWMSTGGLSTRNYVNLLRQTYSAVKAIDPNVIVISGALSPSGGWTEPDGRVSAVNDFSYMDGLIEAGMLDWADCVGAHHNGYNIGPSVLWNQVENDPSATFRGPFDNPHHSWSFRSTLEEYNRKIQLAGGNQKLCVTEFGWASTEDLDGFPPGFEFANDNTLDEQATWTIEALNNMEDWGFVWLAFVWNFNYGPQAGWDTNNDNVPYSIIGPDWQHRPVYDALAEWQQTHQ